MNLLSLRHRVSVAALCAAGLAPSAVLAQTADDTGATGNDRTAAIIVTAERRQSTIQDTPIALNVITGDEINKQAKATIEDVLLDSPSTLVQSAAQGGRVFIRGVGGDGDSNFVDSAVSVMVDNVYSGRSETVYVGTYDVNRFEVLRGPQGTLYGRNATGGNVNIINNQPELDGVHGALNMRIGNYGLIHGDAAINLPVGDSVAVRLAGLRETRDGYFKSYDGATLGGESDLTGARGKIRFQPNDRLDLVVTADYMRSKGWSNISVALPGTPTQLNPDVSDTSLIADPDCAAAYPGQAPCYYAGDDVYTTDGSHPGAYRDLKLFTAYAELNWDLGFGTLTFIPSYSHNKRENTSSLVSGLIGRTLTSAYYDEKQNSQELRIASNSGGPLNWVIGAYRLHTDNFNVTPGSATDPSTTSEAAILNYSPGTVESKALFGEATYSLTDALRVTAGGRYTWDSKDAVIDFTAFDVPGYTTPTYGPATLSDKYSAFTWKLGLQYDLTPDNLLYATVSKGYKAGGYSTQTVPPIAYDPEQLIAYEVGSKNRFANGALTVNLAAFYYDYKNLQFQVNTTDPAYAQVQFLETVLKSAPYSFTDAQYQDYLDAYEATYNNRPDDYRFTIFVVNADTSENYGAEAEVRWLVTPNDELTATYGYLHTEYGNVDFPGLEAVSGAVAANAPKHSLRLGYQHWFDLGNSGELSVRAGTRYSSSYYPATINRDRAGYFQPGYWKSDASITWTDAKGVFSITGWVKNIEDKAVITGSFFRPPLPGNVPGASIFGDPRTYGLTAGIKM